MNAQLLHDVAGFICILASVFVTIGIIRPMFVLWGSSHPTRFKVLALYGSIAAIAGIIFMVTIDPAEDTRKEDSLRETVGQP